MKRLLKYIIAIILILIPAVLLYGGLLEFAGPQRQKQKEQTLSSPADKPIIEQKQNEQIQQSLPSVPQTEESLKTIAIKTASGDVVIKAEVAIAPQERAKGLMFRTSLAQDRGMLFVYAQDQPMTFWMKNTLIPLDVLFINSAKKIVDIQTMSPCLADPCKTYPSKAPAMYALELNSGFAEKNGVVAGNTVTF